MRENSIRELQAIEFCDVQHLGGDRNLSDMFTKEDKDDTHFTTCRDAAIEYPPTYNTHLADSYVTKGGVRNNSPLPVEEYRTDP